MNTTLFVTYIVNPIMQRAISHELIYYSSNVFIKTVSHNWKYIWMTESEKI